MLPLLRSLLILLYSLLFTVFGPLLQMLARVAPRLREQTAGRLGVPALAREMAAARARVKHCVVFFCSSAGEYEQAQPLIQRLGALGGVHVQVIFFSRSGLDFAKARGERVDCCLSPVTDSVWHWGWLFAALRPDVVAVVRHELWPGFLEAARHYGQLFLIDASRSLGETQSRAKRFFRRQLLDLFHRIYAVSDGDAAFFRGQYGIAAGKVVAAGETKYDRVKERVQAQAGAVEALKQRFDAHAAANPPPPRLIFGSAYKQEVELLLAALPLMGPAAERWQVVIAPHHVTGEMVGWIAEACSKAGLSTTRYTQLAAGGPARVIILDTMGMLADAYGTASAAFVGGALHHQVHNVLEPACRGLALAWGPFYKNSQEAVHLVESGLATVVADSAALAGWWRRIDAEGSALTEKVVTAVAALTGASDRILADWRPLLGSG